MEEIEAVIIDRQPLSADALARLLERMDVNVRGLTSSSREGRAMVENYRPNLVIVGVDGFETEADVCQLLHECRDAVPGAKIIVLSSSSEPHLVSTLLAEGAAAYCARTADITDLEVAIRQSFESSIFLAGGWSPPPPVAPTGGSDVLTRREREILQLLAEGYSNAQLARMLWVTQQTVKFHLSNIYRKLKVANRTEASRWAQRNGLVSSAPQEAVDGVHAA